MANIEQAFLKHLIRSGYRLRSFLLIVIIRENTSINHPEGGFVYL